MEEAGVRPGQVVIDLGAGLGALTGPLLDAGARVVAVELHAERAEDLRRRHPDAKVVCCPIEDFRFPRHPFRVVANPPFAKGSALVRSLLRANCTRADLVLPVQVAQRFAQLEPHRGSYRRLPAGAFRPHAPVPTAVLRIGGRPPRR